MAEIITIQAFTSFNFLQITELTADIIEGATSLPVKNESGFDTDHVILLDDAGVENAEIVTPSVVADEDITVAATDHPHKKGTKVYMLRANKARVYAASNVDGSRPTTDTYSLLGTVTLAGDELEPEYQHTGGGPDFWYLYTFYNDIPTSPVESAKVLTDAIRGGWLYHYVTVADVKAEAGLTNNENIPDGFVQDRRDDAESEVKGAISQRYTLPLSYVPPIVRNATKLIAAGWLLLSSYGIGEEGTNKEGTAKLKQGRALLKQIRSGEAALLNPDDTSVAEATSGLNGYPDDDSEDLTPSEGRKFTMTKEF